MVEERRGNMLGERVVSMRLDRCKVTVHESNDSKSGWGAGKHRMV